MVGVVEGFATIAFVIGVGWLLAHVGAVDLAAQEALSRLAFRAAIPALLVTVLAPADVGAVLSSTLAVTGVAIAVVVVLYVAAAVCWWRRPAPHVVVGALGASYANVGNLGIPIAAYVLGDAALVVPVLLLQLVVLQPVSVVAMEMAVSTSRTGVLATVARPLATPVTAGAAVGLVLSLSGTDLPRGMAAPLGLLADMAVPSMLLAYGIYLRRGPRPSLGNLGELATVVTLKLVVQPAVAWVTGRFVVGMDDTALLAVTVIAALPTAQHVFTHAAQYDRGVELARAVFATTVLSVPVIAAVTAALGGVS